jgi:hypothetical protein
MLRPASLPIIASVADQVLVCGAVGDRVLITSGRAGLDTAGCDLKIPSMSSRRWLPATEAVPNGGVGAA